MKFALLRKGLRTSALALGILALGPWVAPAQAAQSLVSVHQASSDPGIKGFYKARNDRLLWFRDGAPVPAARRLVDIIKRADLDGMNGAPALASRLDEALDRARSGSATEVARAEILLSSAWINYVQTLRRPVDVGMVYTDGSLQPFAPLAPEVLTALAEAPSMEAHLKSASELNPIYDRLRAGLREWREQGRKVKGSNKDARQIEERLKLNLDRARALPAQQSQPYILVDAASAQLWLIENGEIRETMRVVVGMPTQQTPMVAGLIKTAVLNPYWNVPPDLVRSRVAPGVLKEGISFLKKKNYELLSDWSNKAKPLDPKRVDWEAVAAGQKEVRVRQLPGPGNAMGDMKFMFPNEFGIYLHDTPDKSLFSQRERKLSSGCVRLEDAARLAGWLFGTPPRAASSAPEQVVALPKPVPVYITYLTAEWTGQQFAFRDDAYGRDLNTIRFADSAAGGDRSLRGSFR